MHWAVLPRPRVLIFFPFPFLTVEDAHSDSEHSTHHGTGIRGCRRSMVAVRSSQRAAVLALRCVARGRKE
jgi:hypothetical protein